MRYTLERLNRLIEELLNRNYAKDFTTEEEMVAVVNREVGKVKRELMEWVQLELEYIERRQRRGKLREDGHLVMNLPVQGLGILVRSAAEEGLLAGESVEGAIEKAVRVFATPGTVGRNGASSESVRIKSYNPSKKDKELVMGPLYGMIRRISKY